MINYIEGDLIKLAKEGKYDVIIHGCNCFNTMGAGIALQIAKTFKDAYLEDQKTISGDESKLGTIIPVEVSLKNSKLIVINAYTQYHYGLTSIPNTRYHAVQSCFQKIKKDFGDKNLRFGIPKIGAGLGGGSWNIISAIIKKEMKDENVDVVLYKEK